MEQCCIPALQPPAVKTTQQLLVCAFCAYTAGFQICGRSCWGAETLSLCTRSLEERAREYNISDLQSLYTSAAFRDAGFSLDQQRQLITLPR